MFQTLRIVFTLLSALCVAVVIPVGVFGGFTASVVCAGLAFTFFLAMLYFKGKQEQSTPESSEPTPDFLSPQPNAEEKENETNE